MTKQEVRRFAAQQRAALDLSAVGAGMATACTSEAAPDRPEVMVNLRTVQSGPAVQAAELNGAIAQQPRNAVLYARRAAFHLEAGQVAPALHDINLAISLDDEAPGEFYLTKARALRAQGRLQAAVAAAAQAQQRGYNPPELHLLLGETYLASHNYRNALDGLARDAEGALPHPLDLEAAPGRRAEDPVLGHKGGVRSKKLRQAMSLVVETEELAVVVAETSANPSKMVRSRSGSEGLE